MLKLSCLIGTKVVTPGYDSGGSLDVCLLSQSFCLPQPFQLRRNSLTRIDGLDGYTNLYALNLSNNEFTNVPLDIQHLTLLECLQLADNPLRSFELPLGFSAFLHLTELYLDQNCLEHLPPQLSQLCALDVLSLSASFCLANVDGIDRCTSLRYLLLNDSPNLVRIDGVEHFHLNELHLYNTPLPNVRPGWVSMSGCRDAVQACHKHCRLAQRGVVEWAIALAPLRLPPYVVLHIFDSLASQRVSSRTVLRQAEPRIAIPAHNEAAIDENYFHILVEDRTHHQNIQLFVYMQKRTK